MKRDVLHALVSGSMSLDEVEGFYDRLMDSGEVGRAAELLGMSPAEWTAFAQGVWFDELAGWRSRGWPRNCVVCGKEVDIPQFGWLVREMMGTPRLAHVACIRLD